MIYWIGGSACSGKSTLANMYAEKHGLALYSCDEHFDRHLNDISIVEHPAMYKVRTMDPNEAFYTRDVQEQLSVYIRCFMEDFAFVLKDIADGPGTPLVVEGNQLLPSLVAPRLKQHHKAIWIIPAERFQREHYSKRAWIQEILQKTENPAAAFHNWMLRDARFAGFVAQEAADLNLQVLHVDGSKSLMENYAFLEKHFDSK